MKLLFDLRAAQSNISGKRHGGGRFAEVVFSRIVEKGTSCLLFLQFEFLVKPRNQTTFR